MDAEELMLQKCKSLIETRLGWDESGSWSNHDFQMLSEKIQETTGINLSVATLKRIWGKVRYDSKPTITTLNTLAQFTGYENWRAFKQDHNGHGLNGSALQNSVSQAENPAAQPGSGSARRNFWRSGLIGTALCGGIVFILYYIMTVKSDDGILGAPPSEYAFSSKKVVSEGVPNSVIFDYNASAAATDSIYIQQSWDERLRTKVSRDQHQHTSIYYTPGFFHAKLVVGGEIVKEHKLFITSKGWLALVKQEPVPVYFKDADFKRPGMLSLPLTRLTESSIPFQPDIPLTSYYNVRDFGDLRTDDFVFETTLRNDYREGAGVCQRSQIVILTEGNVIMIPLSIKGCVSDLSLFVGDSYVDGKKADLSAFGCDLSEWVKVKCEVRSRTGRVYINDVLAFEGPFTTSDKIVGLIYRFQGTGSVDEVRFTNAKGEKFLDDPF